jgi:hypothetical protein
LVVLPVSSPMMNRTIFSFPIHVSMMPSASRRFGMPWPFVLMICSLIGTFCAFGFECQRRFSFDSLSGRLFVCFHPVSSFFNLPF